MNEILKQAKVFEENGEYKSAIKCYDNYLESKNSTAEIFVQRGDLYKQLDNYEYSMRDYSIAINIEPENPIYYHKRASIKELLENYVEALNDYHKAYNLCLENTKYKELISRYWNDYDDVHHLLVQKNKEV